MAKHSILALGPRKVAHLLGITFDSAEEDKAGSERKIAEMLEARLAGPLPTDTAEFQDPPEVVGKRDSNIGQYPAGSLGDVLTASETEFATLKEIRRYAKKAMRGKSREVERVAVTIYFAAIANALLFHQARITSYSYGSLEISFNKLIKKSWMPRRLRRLFVDAAGACRDRKQEVASRPRPAQGKKRPATSS